MSKRVFLIVLDSFGIGEMPDAGLWHDEGSNTLGAIRGHENFYCPNLERLGLFNIDGVGGSKTEKPAASFARLGELSMGKDTTIGHWEIAGAISKEPLPTYPDGFPADLLEELERLIGRRILCNKPYSGTEVIKDFGEEQRNTGAVIVYTSADSVFQIAAHEDTVPIEELYQICETARKLLTGKHGVGRVIARPFAGEYPFCRTPRRHDYSLVPPKQTMLDRLTEAGYDVLSIGKISDIFAGKGISEQNRTENNDHGMELTLQMADRDFRGLCFVNLVDFDMVYGHRNDIAGYAKAATAFDRKLGDLLAKLRDDDLLFITADHGCDPATESTDHSREYVPVLMYGKHIKQGVNLGTRNGFCDISATILEYFGVPQGETSGVSFLRECASEAAFAGDNFPDDTALMELAAQARQSAYAPYSGYQVGAALLTAAGKVYTGCNIENASYTPTVCAERTAFFKAVSEGERHFIKLAVVGGRKGETADFCAPCGVCRQVMAEFCDEDFILILGTPEKHKEYRLSDILPAMFTKKDL